MVKLLINLSILANLALTHAISVPTLLTFSQWKAKFGKNYQNAIEEHYRLEVFTNMRDFIHDHNLRFLRNEETYFVDLNMHSDKTEEEWFALTNETPEGVDSDPVVGNQNYPCTAWNQGSPDPISVNGTCTDCYTDSPTESTFQWNNQVFNPSNQVMVTPVKDQASCGSCWAFAATAVVESRLCMNGQYDCENWTGISEQNVVDCAFCDMANDCSTYTGCYCSHGCSGGNSQNGWWLMYSQAGISTDDSYPYTSGTSRTEGSCMTWSYTDNAWNQTTIDNTNAFAAGQNIDSKSICLSVPNYDEFQMMQAVNKQGPLKVSIYASETGFRAYAGGIYTTKNCPGQSTNHAVTVTGYGTDNSEDQPLDYFYVKNSWGTSWGLSGYIKFRRNYGSMCGIAKKPYFTEVPMSATF